MENTTSISVEKVLSLQQTIDAQKVEISAKDREVGALEAHIETLETRMSEIKSEYEAKQPQVVVMEEYDEFFGTNSRIKEYRNLDSVKLDIEKVLDKKYKSDIEKLEKDLKSVKSELEDKKEEVVRAKARLNSEIENIRTEYHLYTEAADRDYKERTAKKDLKIKELQEDIIKIKEDKTDEQLNKLREEEISLLKKQIEAINSLGFFKRIFYAITKNFTAAVAEVEILKNKREQERLENESYWNKAMRKLRGNYNNYGVYNW